MRPRPNGGGSRGPTREMLPHAQPGPNEAVDREIRHHVEEQIERLMEADIPPDEARREAERRFGDVARIRDEVRAVGASTSAWSILVALIAGTARDLRYAVRFASRSPWLSLTIIVTLGLGIGANTAIFSLVEAVLLRPLPFPEPDRMAYVTELTAEGRPFAVAPANFLDWRERQRSFEALGLIAGANALVSEGGPAQRVTGVRVSGDYFGVLGIEPALGRTFDAEEDGAAAGNVVVVSHAFWVGRLASDPGVIGRSVRLDGDPHTVIGVMPEGVLAFQRWYSEAPITVWRPNPFAMDARSEREIKRLSVIARLRDGVSMEQADAEMKGLASGLAEEHPDTNEGWSAGVSALPEAMSADVRMPLLVLFGAVGFVLLIACLNVGSLLLARADERRSSITLRRALGANRAAIIRQLLAESLILSLGAAGLGIAIAKVLLPVLLVSSPINVSRMGTVQVNEAVLIFSLALAVLTALITGLAPAIGVSAPHLGRELKERGLGSTESRRARAGRSTLVVAEIALSVVLVIGGGLMMASYLRLSGLELGFEPEEVVRVGALLPRERYADPIDGVSDQGTGNFTVWRPNAEEIGFMEQVEAAMARLPGVESVAAGNYDPSPGGVWAWPIRPEGEPPPASGDEVWAMIRPVSPQYLETVRIPIVRGRPIQEADRARPEDIAVIDEAAAARLWPGQNPVGRSVMFRDGQRDIERPFRVVGVARQARQGIFFDGGQVAPGDFPVVYLPYRRQAEAYVDWQVNFRMRSVFLVRTNRDLGDIAPELRQVVASYDSELPVTVQRLTDTLAGPLANRRFYMSMLVAFGALAVLFAASGVFAVMAYSVTRKTRELGIRLALGARGAQLERSEIARGLRLALLGLVIGGLGAAWLTRFIASFLYGVGTVDPLTYSATAVLIVAVVLAAAYVPARRASAVDAMECLRTE